MSEQNLLPPDWPLSFTTPATLVATAAEAKALSGKLSVIGLDKEGYFHPTLALPIQVELKARTTTRIEIPMRPMSPVGSPLSRPALVSLVHVSPASTDFHSALPGPPPWKPQGRWAP